MIEPAAPVLQPRPAPLLHELRQGRLDYLDGIRALAALDVVMGHTVWQVWPADWAPARGIWHALLIPFHFAHTAVGVFIILSGFCLMLPVARRDGVLAGGAGRFFLRRCRRILPPFYTAAIVSIVLGKTLLRFKTGTTWDQCIAWTPMGVMSNFFLVHNFVEHSEVNYVFWSIAVEWQIYFAFPLLVIAFRFLSPIATVACTFFISLGLFVLGRNTRLAGLAPQYTLLFTLGMLAATISYNPKWSQVKARVPWLVVTAAFAVVFLIILRLWQHSMTGVHLFLGDASIGPLVAPFLIALSRSETGMLRRCLSVRPLVLIGTFSYSLYLIHAPLLQLAWQYVLMPMHLSGLAMYLILLCIGVPCILLTAYAFFWVAERPFLSNARPSSDMNKLAREVVVSPAP